MTGPGDVPRRARPSMADNMQSTEGLLRHGGRELLGTFYTALRSLKLYPIENAGAQRALDDLAGAAQALLQIEQDLEIRVSGEFIFINSTRLRLGLDNYAAFSHVLATLRKCGIGVIHVGGEVTRKEWQVFVSLLLAAGAGGGDAEHERLVQFQGKAAQGGVTHIRVEALIEGDEEGDGEATEKVKEVAKQTYERSVAVTKEVVNSVRMGRSASVKKVKRAVQSIVDQVLSNEESLVGLTTIRDYDEYTFTHSVNVCIFSVAIGRRLGFSRLQLYDLGLAALFHDVGKSRVPIEVINKDGPLSEEEWRIMQAHPWLGVLTLFGLRGYGEIPYRGMIVAYEHHMKIDLTGYPRSLRPRTLSMFSKIVAVADGFDAATSRRSYQTTPLQPDQVLKEMWENPRRGLDQVLVKALVNLLGVYPVGTCVVLDTYDVAVVQSANPNVDLLNRPRVRIVCTADGGQPRPAPLVDLGETDANGAFLRTIIKVADPAKYGINPAAFLV